MSTGVIDHTFTAGSQTSAYIESPGNFRYAFIDRDAAGITFNAEIQANTDGNPGGTEWRRVGDAFTAEVQDRGFDGGFHGRKTYLRVHCVSTTGPLVVRLG